MSVHFFWAPSSDLYQEKSWIIGICGEWSDLLNPKPGEGGMPHYFCKNNTFISFLKPFSELIAWCERDKPFHACPEIYFSVISWSTTSFDLFSMEVPALIYRLWQNQVAFTEKVQIHQIRLQLEDQCFPASILIPGSSPYSTQCPSALYILDSSFLHLVICMILYQNTFSLSLT